MRFLFLFPVALALLGNAAAVRSDFAHLDNDRSSSPLRRHDAEPQQVDDDCKSVSDLEAIFQETQNAQQALNSWCGSNCAICLGDCPVLPKSCWRNSSSTETQRTLFWHHEKPAPLPDPPIMYLRIRGNTFILGGPPDSPDSCAETKLGGHGCKDHNCAELSRIGALNKELRGVCTQFKMSTVAFMQISILRALGIKQMTARDASHFAPECGRPMRFVAKILKGMTQGRTMYQGWYGDAFSFSRLDLDCQARLDAMYANAKGAGLDKTAEEVLSLTKTVTVNDKTSCRPAWNKYLTLQSLDQDFEPVGSPGGVRNCDDFVVDVASAPQACGA